MGNPIGTLYTTAEAAEILKISERSVQRYIAAGEIKASLIGGGYRIKEDELRQFVERRTGLRLRKPRNSQFLLKSSK